MSPRRFELFHPAQFTALYFLKTQEILDKFQINDIVTMQVFQKEDAVLSGIDEAIGIMKGILGNEWANIQVMALEEGAKIAPWESVMTITGPLRLFVMFESVYLGILRTGTTVATNISKAVAAARGKPVIYLADRFQHPAAQATQGLGATTGGATAVCTAEMALFTGTPVVGTMPHALIAAYGGSVAKACKAYAETFPDQPVTALVDFNNDCVTDAINAFEAVGEKLYGVRLDTSEKMIDRSLVEPENHPLWGAFSHAPHSHETEHNGVTPQLVRNVRAALDAVGANDTKIIVSGGFNPDKISRFEDELVPVDVYGVGSSALKGGSDFTADVVLPVAKEGRRFRPNTRLRLVR